MKKGNGGKTTPPFKEIFSEPWQPDAKAMWRYFEKQYPESQYRGQVAKAVGIDPDDEKELYKMFRKFGYTRPVFPNKQAIMLFDSDRIDAAMEIVTGLIMKIEGKVRQQVLLVFQNPVLHDRMLDVARKELSDLSKRLGDMKRIKG